LFRSRICGKQKPTNSILKKLQLEIARVKTKELLQQTQQGANNTKAKLRATEFNKNVGFNAISSLNIVGKVPYIFVIVMIHVSP